MASGSSEQVVSPSSEFTNSSEDTISTADDPEETNQFTAEILPNEFSLKTWKDDLTLVLEEQELYVASTYLALESPVFHAKFDEAFKEDGPRRLELPGSYDDFVEFLRCIYPGLKKQITEENVLKVAPLAHEYKVKNVMTTCEEMLKYIVSESSVERISTILNNPSLGQISTLRQMCIEELSTRKEFKVDEQPFDEIMCKLQIPHDIQMGILKTRVSYLEENEQNLQVRCDKERDNHKEDRDMHEDFKDLVRNIWLEILEIKNPANFELSRLNVKISKGDAMRETSIKVRDITWTLSARFEQSGDLLVDFSAKGCHSWGNWTFKCRAACCVSKGSMRVWKYIDIGKYCNNSGIRFSREMDQFSNKDDLSVSVIFAVGDVLM